MSDVIIGSDVRMQGNADLATSSTGDLDIVGGNDNLVQAAINNLTLPYGADEWDPERGNMAFTRRTKLVDTGMDIMRDDCRKAILYDKRVKDVPYIDVQRGKDYECVIAFTLKRLDDVIVDGVTNVDFKEG